MKPIALLSLAAALGTVTSASAITVVWSAGAGKWNDGLNWTGGVAPVATSDIGRIANAGSALYDSTMSYSFGGVELGPGSGSGNFEMTGGGLTTSTDIRVGGNAAANGGSGVFTMSGGNITMTGGNFNLGFGSTASGTVNLNSGSIIVQFSTILAVGNRGSGTVNQTGGTFQVLGTSAPTTTIAQLGRNVAAGTGSGTYNLSGGSLTAASLVYGQAVSTVAGSVNTFALSGSGVLTVGAISIVNTNAVNSFNFTGGRLVVENVNLSLTNSGGTLEPTDLDFAGASAASIPADVTGILTFGTDASYTQSGTAVLAIDIDGPGSSDFVNIGSGASTGSATLGGTIAVNLIGAYDPPLGTTFDVLAADSITNSAAVAGTTPSGLGFVAGKVTGGDGREVLRLTVVPALTPLVLTQVGPLAGNSFPVTWASDTASVYRVDTSTDLTQWTEGGNIPGQSPTTTFSDTLPPQQMRRFYRVVRVSP